MEFRSGDNVIHPNYGVANIVRLEERDLATSGLRWYYVLAIGTATVWMPVHADGSTPLRAVTRKQDLEQYRSVLSSQPTLLNRDFRKRNLEILERLTHQSFQVMCEIVRDLTALGWNRPMGETDATMLKKVRDNLSGEWAAANGQSRLEAVQEVEALLRSGRIAHKTEPPPVQRRN